MFPRQRALAAAIDRRGRPLWQTIAGLVAEFGLPGRLRDVGLSEGDLPRLAESALAYSPVLHNPRRIQNAADVMEILRLAW
jgi:alcohol dehydrogenase class IV